MSNIVGDFRVDIDVAGHSSARKATYTLTRLTGRGAGISLIRRMLPETFKDIGEALSVARAVGEAHAYRLTQAYIQFLSSRRVCNSGPAGKATHNCVQTIFSIDVGEKRRD
jgi:hypothetical protein